jgi:hypothetical protein
LKGEPKGKEKNTARASKNRIKKIKIGEQRKKLIIIWDKEKEVYKSLEEKSFICWSFTINCCYFP